MTRGVRWYLVGSVVLGVLGLLAGCSGGGLFVEREPWRREAEVQCLNSGAVKEGAGIVRIKPINGPGMCGADFPLKVSALGESGALGYGDEVRPPGSIPNVGHSAAAGRSPIDAHRSAAAARRRADLRRPGAPPRLRPLPLRAEPGVADRRPRPNTPLRFPQALRRAAGLSMHRRPQRARRAARAGRAAGRSPPRRRYR